MPIKIDGKSMEFSEAVEHIKRTRPNIKSPGGYVKSIEEKQRGAKLRLAILKTKIATTSISNEERVKQRAEKLHKFYKDKPFKDIPEEDIATFSFEQAGTKIRPQKPIRKDFRKIIQARLGQIREELKEQKIGRLHKHEIVYRYVPLKGGMKVASLSDITGKYVKYWLLNAKQINGNHWGVSPVSIAQNIKKFIGKPFVITAQEWIPDSEYGDEYRHPYIKSNDIYQVMKHQAKYAVGIIRDVYEQKDEWYASIEMAPRFASMPLPPFCSPAIFQLNPYESDLALTEWEPLHLAGLWINPAYGARIALLKGTCIGTPNQCSVRFRGAQLSAAIGTSFIDEDLKQRRLKRLLGDITIPEKGGDIKIPPAALTKEVPFGFGEKLDEIKFEEFMTMGKEQGEQQEEFIKGKRQSIRPSKPDQRHFQRIIQARLAALRSATNKATQRVNLYRPRRKKRTMTAQLHPRAHEIDLALKISKDKPQASSFLTPSGQYKVGTGNHYEVVRELGGIVGMEFERHRSDAILDVSDGDIHNFLNKTGMVRVQNFPNIQKTSIHVGNELTSAQLERIKQIQEDDPNTELGFVVGKTLDDADVVTSGNFNDFMKFYRKHFGVKDAQAEGTTNVFNMTFTKSKPHKVKKRRIR